LVSRNRQTVVIDKQQFEFAAGESIHTESSYKYTIAEFQQLASLGGFLPISVWTDAEEYFSVHYFEVPSS
ncbi:MAG: L-histidine N(alpha)-methyltransferase, partial [Gammaproteobacteria bacterium]